MTNTSEKCTENAQDTCKIMKLACEPNENTLQNRIYYLLQIAGDPEFRLPARSAKKNGVKAEFTAAGWIYQNKKDAEETANRWSQGKRKLTVVPWFDSRLDAIWNGTKNEARLARNAISIEIDSNRLNTIKQNIILECTKSPLHHSWLYEDDISKLEAAGCSEKEIEAYKYFKPQWDKAFEKQEEIDLRGADLAREEEDLCEALEIKEKKQLMPLEIITKGLIRNERGDAELFLNLLPNKYHFDHSEGKDGQFYVWNKTNWQIDRKKQRYKDIEIVSEAYEKAAIQSSRNENTLELSKEFSKRAHALRSARRCKSVFEFISSEIPLNGEWDCCPGKLPCLNGIVDLKTGSISNHKPEYLLRSICPTSYIPHAKRPLFDKFLDDITLDDFELKAFLGRVLGSALLGTPKEEKVFIFYGKDGRNGKGTLMQTLENVLGPLAKTFPSEMLLLQRNPPSSSTPRPEKANLQGVRFAIFSEIDEKRQIDASEVKNLSGRDTITCRRLFSNVDIQIKPSHTMFIQTNFKPKASAKDGALWKRNVLIPFNAEFVEKPTKQHERKKDEGFKEKLLLEREGILAWLVEGCLEYQRIGLAIPKIVQDETANYRKENDGIQLFIEDKCTLDPVFSTPCSKMQAAIKDYCKSQGHNIPNEREIANWLRGHFGDPKKSSRGTFYMGIGINSTETFDE